MWHFHKLLADLTGLSISPPPKMRVDHERRPSTSSGVVLRFDPDKGYGRIRRTDGSGTIIVYQSAVERSGLIGLFPGQEVEFDLVPWGGYHIRADNLRLIAACAE
jgi:cold shock protein